MLQYAKKRCEAASRFAGGINCIGNEEMVRWSNKVETCIQNSLQKVITRQFESVESDPVTCLRLERKAIDTINECYHNPEEKNNHYVPELCQLLGDSISESERQDLTSFVSGFNVGGEYHTATVDSGIPELVRECGHSEVADSLYVGRPTYRLVFCVWAVHLAHASIPGEDYIEFISQQLGDSKSNFQYGGPGMHKKCDLVTPPGSQSDFRGRYDFHVVTWFAASNNTVARNLNKTETTSGRIKFSIVTGFYEYTDDLQDYLENTIRDTSKCGNGRRDPGEMCDYAMLNSTACTFDCDIDQSVDDAYECSVERLDRSYCWEQKCGDGKRTSAEECDDGNLNNNDGCSSQCRFERPQFICKNSYNRTTYCVPLPAIVSNVQRQVSRSNVVHKERAESLPPRPSAIVDASLEESGLSSARRLVSRTGLLVSTVVLMTLWTMLTFLV